MRDCVDHDLLGSSKEDSADHEHHTKTIRFNQWLMTCLKMQVQLESDIGLCHDPFRQYLNEIIEQNQANTNFKERKHKMRHHYCGP